MSEGIFVLITYEHYLVQVLVQVIASLIPHQLFYCDELSVANRLIQLYRYL